MKRSITNTVFAAVAATAFAGGALADGMPAGSMKDAPKAAEGRTFAYSWNLGVTSDYIFRGISQNRRDPAAQGGVDMTYGIFYAGIWGSDINFGRNGDGTAVGNVEVDVYAGIKPVLGPVTFDLGVISYNYLGGKDKGPRFNQAREQDFVELKAGASATFIPKLTTGVTLFYSPSFQQGQGSVTTVEGTIAYELPAVMKIVPTIGGTIGGQFGDAGSIDKPYVFANGKDSYTYWNAGLALAIDKLTLDFRYWDTSIPNSNLALGSTNFCNQDLFGCDGRFVASAKVTF